MANRWGNSGNSVRLYFGGLQIHYIWWLQPWNQKMIAPWKKSYEQTRQHIKKQRHYFASKGPSSQSYGFSSSHVWMWELNHKWEWAVKNWCFWTVELRKTLESLRTARRSNQSILKEISPEYSLEVLMLKLNLQYFGYLMQRANSLEKDADDEKDWGQEEKGMTGDEMTGWHHRLNRHEFEQTLGDSEEQGILGCCSPWAFQCQTWLTS